MPAYLKRNPTVTAHFYLIEHDGERGEENSKMAVIATSVEDALTLFHKSYRGTLVTVYSVTLEFTLSHMTESAAKLLEKNR
jgi:hypothetical protein